MSTVYIWMGIAVMALVTYLIRCIPMVVFRKKIKSRWVQSFLYYVPYTVLTAMTVPAVFTSTGSVLGASLGCMVAVVLAYFKKGLLTVALCSAFVAFLIQFIGL